MTSGSETESDRLRVSGIFEGEAVLGETDGELVCADGTLRYRGPGGPVEVPGAAVNATRVDRDRSATGFRTVAGAFALAALLMGSLFADHAVVGGGQLFSVVGLGSGLSAALSAAAVPWLYRLDAGERTVLHLERENGEPLRFVAPGECDALREVGRRMRSER